MSADERNGNDASWIVLLAIVVCCGLPATLVALGALGVGAGAASTRITWIVLGVALLLLALAIRSLARRDRRGRAGRR